MSMQTRRRFLLIAAGAALSGGLGWSRTAESQTRAAWEGVSLGARSRILIDHPNRDAADDCLAACREEIERLEALFSLYRSDSAIVRLNAAGRLDSPDADFLQLLSLARSVHAASDGAFDPTVQPLWQAHARRYTQAARDAAETELTDALASTGFDRVRFEAGEIAFGRPGMALTLNGIAQGYITDRIADLLRARDFRHVLVDIGELRALGPQQDGRGWPVTIAGSNRIVSLKDRALATSATLGTTFDSAGRVGHILDPHTGRAMTARRQMTISAPTAALADALSTAACAAPQDVADILQAFPEARLVSTSA